MPDTTRITVSIKCAGELVPVEVEFRHRERLSISVSPDGAVTATAPVGRSLAEVLTHLNRRRSWVAKQRRYFERFQPLPVEKRYVSGETHLFLGRQYRLRVHQSDDTNVRLVGKFFEVNIPTPKQPQLIAEVMEDWYQSHAEAILNERLLRCIQAFSLLRLHPDVKFRVRPMKRRWGSCSRAGMVTLNPDLVKTPLHCIDYVIVHELCHLRIHDHSAAFLRLLGCCMPDWKARKGRLESIVMR